MSLRHPKQYRLLGAGEFGPVFEKAKLKAPSPQLLLLGLATDNGYARLGLVISKKHVGNAVARNRIKRLSREVFRQRASALPAMDIVVLARGGLAELDNPAVIALLAQQFDVLAAQYRRRAVPLSSASKMSVNNANQ